MPWHPTVVDSQILAIHVALVPSGDQGEVLLFGGDEHWSAQQEPGGDFRKTRVYDVRTHALISAAIPSSDSDVFCAGHAFTGDGRLLSEQNFSREAQERLKKDSVDLAGAPRRRAIECATVRPCRRHDGRRVAPTEARRAGRRRNQSLHRPRRVLGAGPRAAQTNRGRGLGAPA